MSCESVFNRELSSLLLETEVFMDQLDELSIVNAVELYGLLDETAKIATQHIGVIDTDLRVTICDRQDKLLERIVDELPLFDHTGDPLGIYTPALLDRRWRNEQLMKDCGLSVYTLAMALAATPVMYFGTKPSDYPYLSNLPGMKIIYDESEPGTAEAYYDHLNASFLKMDVIVLYGIYHESIEFLNAYRALRPDGKVYCALDMNSYWMDTAPWGSAEAGRFAGQCDVTATSCRQMRDALNRRADVKFPCRWLTNGFYNPTDVEVIADPEHKDNIILTVGRIGTYQKNTEELLSAFASVSGVLPGWSLRLVGPIESDFHTYIDSYFSQYPKLKDRVVFTGPITDKEELYSEYAKAKIFALTSVAEGFPNVYSEALFHGCMFITSDIDAAEDITNYDQLGMIYKSTDINALCTALVEMCLSADKRGMQTHIPKALEYANKYYDWKRIAKKLAYMLFRQPGS